MANNKNFDIDSSAVIRDVQAIPVDDERQHFKKLHIKNPNNLSKAALFNIFSNYGSMKDLQFFTSFAFAEYENSCDAEEALRDFAKSKTFDLKVSWAKQKEEQVHLAEEFAKMESINFQDTRPPLEPIVHAAPKSRLVPKFPFCLIQPLPPKPRPTFAVDPNVDSDMSEFICVVCGHFGDVEYKRCGVTYCSYACLAKNIPCENTEEVLKARGHSDASASSLTSHRCSTSW